MEQINPFTNALKLFGPEGEHWGKGMERIVTESNYYYCSTGGLRYGLAYQQALNLYNQPIITPTLLDATGLLASKLSKHLVPYSTTDIVQFWNDKSSTKWEDVKYYFELCEKEWENEVNP